ncbi:hypothetical protein KKG08_00550 [Patescibacteria group bacterium]|nr:hypothetical protein [Patescibacteria group bacterium]
MKNNIESRSEETFAEPSSLELAQNWLEHSAAVVMTKLRRNEKSTKFTEGYNPTSRVRPSYVEPGGVDASDWDTEELEAQQWPQEQEKELGSLENEREDLTDELSELSSINEKFSEFKKNHMTTVVEFERITWTIEDLVEEFAKREKIWRAEIGEKQKLTEEGDISSYSE